MKKMIAESKTNIPVFWLMGLSASGKTTLAELAKDYLESDQKLFPAVSRWALLDGDVIRSFLGDEIGYTFAERRKSVRVMGLLAKTLAENKVGVIVANISPFHDLREFMRKNIPGYKEIYCKCPISSCMARDPKGNYKTLEKSALKNYIGIDIPFQEPESPDVIIETDGNSLQDSKALLFSYIAKVAGAR
jgi:adenylyl-sulfate kinase